LFALNWGNVDWINDRIYVEGAIIQDAEEIEDTKTEAGERTVNLLPPALAALKAQKEYTFLKGAEVFQNPHMRERWKGDQALRTRQWNTLCRRAGVQPSSWSDASYVRVDVVDGGRVAAVGCCADGAYRLDVHGAGLLSVDS
jgi:integrase